MQHTFIIPGKQFQLSVEALRQKLMGAVETQAPTLTSVEIFEFIQLTQNNLILQNELLARTPFKRQGDGSYYNKGRPVYRDVVDLGPNLQDLKLYLPRRVYFEPEVAGDTFSITPASGTRIFVQFKTPPAPGFGRRFILDKIAGTLEKWRYSFHDDVNVNTTIAIDVDLTVEPVSKLMRGLDPSTGRRLRLERSALGHSSFSIFPACVCDSCIEHVTLPGKCPPDEKDLFIDLRAIVILDNGETLSMFQSNVDQQIDGIRQIFSQHRINVNVASIDSFLDPANLTIAVGQCRSNVVTADIQRLFTKYGATIQAGEVVAFFVSTVVGFAGCAVHPSNQIGFLIDRDLGGGSVKYVGAHELGHNLSLQHVPNADNLMFAGSWTKFPPEMDSQQTSQARCQKWLKV